MDGVALKVEQLQQQYNNVQAAKRHAVKQLRKAKREADGVAAGLAYVIKAAQQVQRKAHTQIAHIVTLCLHAVFTTAYNFRIDFETKRNKTVAELVLSKNGHDIGDPIEEDSGGVCDVASYALRLCCLLMAKPARSRVIILDEPFKFVSEEYRANVVQLVKQLAKDFDTQFIIVTNIPELVMGKVVWI